MYVLKTRSKLLSLHLTLEGARDALRKYQFSDTRGELAVIDYVDTSELKYAAIVIGFCVAIATMLAWRG